MDDTLEDEEGEVEGDDDDNDNNDNSANNDGIVNNTVFSSVIDQSA
jgi:hypothetical protein